MKTLTTILILFIGFSVNAQLSMDDVIGSNTITIIEFNTKIGAKIVQKRFDLAVIGKDVNEIICDCKLIKKALKHKVTQKGYSNHTARFVYRDYCKDNYFIELEENDENEYFRFIGLKIHCIPRRLRGEILTFEIETL